MKTVMKIKSNAERDGCLTGESWPSGFSLEAAGDSVSEFSDTMRYPLYPRTYHHANKHNNGNATNMTSAVISVEREFCGQRPIEPNVG